MQKIKPLNDQVLFTGQSLQLNEFTFEDNLGNEKSAEVIRKISSVENNTADNSVSVLSVAILRHHILCDCLILVKKYRPTLKSYVLEFPAKIIESHLHDDETREAAMKHVENRTGYKSISVYHISPETAVDPDLCDGKSKLVSIIIEGDDHIKNGIRDHQERLSDVDIIQLPINGLLGRLNEYAKNGVIIDSRVYGFAIGLKNGLKLSKISAKPENIEIPI